MATTIKKAWVVISGSLDESPENVEVLGVFTKEKNAYDFRNGEYKSMNDIDDEDHDMGPDLNSSFIDDGHQFWAVQETILG